MFHDFAVPTSMYGMYLMQYEISLPADYDMGIIRRRVGKAAPMLDDFAGLALKAYVIREGRVNQYAPFYLWHNVEAMNRFLWFGGGFGRILDSFGRPVVQHWLGTVTEQGPAHAAQPNGASKRVEALSPDADPMAAVAAAIDRAAERAKLDDVHTVAAGIDPRGWQLVQFTLWEGPAREDEQRYEVLHISAPVRSSG
jgi:hypothetical protein